MTLGENKSILSAVLILIFAILFGLGLAFFATQNTNGVTITLANTPLTEIPLYIIVIGSLLLGLLLASFFNVANLISSAFKLRGKDTTIKGADKTIATLKSENHNLKAEVADLKAKKILV